MAEAHQAVSYSELIKQEHTDSNHDKEVLALVFQSGVRSWKKRIARSITKARNGVYPAHIESLFVIIGTVMALHFANQKAPFDLVNKISPLMPESTVGWQTVTCCIAGLIYWISICLMMRYTLKFLLMYKGFLFETRGKGISLKTKIWAALVKVFVKWNTPTIYSFQGSLPHLPVPALKDTVRRYLRSVRPLLDDNSYADVVKQSEEFLNGIGKKLQRYVVLKSWWSANYVSDWWEEYVYLRGRSPLMVNSNYYGTDYLAYPSKRQTDRAANIIYLMLQFRKKVDRQELKPIMVQGFVPLCSWQYERIFNTTRIPGVEADKIVHLKDSKHIAVLHKGCFYKVPIYHRGRLLNASEIKYQLDKIVEQGLTGSHGENHLAALTSWHRTKWAQTRDKHFSKGVNKVSLNVIESAAFFVTLHDQDYGWIDGDREGWLSYAKQCLHGNVNDRWFDKSFQICIGKNGIYNLNGEHAWADAPVNGHFIEEVCYDDIQSYDSEGRIKGKMEMQPPEPTKLFWEFNSDLLKNIDEAYKDGLEMIKNVDHEIVNHDAFGKGLIKKCKTSPDAFIQMALQLAYFRDAGKFSLTYEASMTRLYREGRTETVRPCTIESAAWVRSMDDPKCNNEDRMKLFQKACLRHQKGYLDAMVGNGIDRHLFCLYVVSKYLEVESPFLKQAIGEPWRLSTSQTPHGQTNKIDLKKYPGLITPGGGFGPVSSDGYSVSYIISGEDNIFFHLSSNKGCETTNTARFGKAIFKALDDTRKLFESNKKEN